MIYSYALFPFFSDSEFDVSDIINDVIIPEEPLLQIDVIPDDTDLLLDGPISYKLIEGGNRKAGLLLVDSLGFTYAKKRTTGVAVWWRCRTGKNCLATVRQPVGTCLYERGQKTHNHAAKPGIEIKSTIRATVKATARANMFATSTDIVNQAFGEINLPAVEAELPNFNTLLRQANRVRENLRPRHPHDLDFQLDVDNIPDGFFQKDIKHKGQRHIILATALQLEYLSRAKVWFLDGTFKVVREPFSQLFTIHSFIKVGSGMKQVPLCFVYMSGKKQSDYKIVLKTILSLLESAPAVEECIMDFERAIWSSIRTVLPNVGIHGCWFHWAQAVFRQIKKKGLQSAYVHQLPVRNFLRQIMALPNLPHEHIIPAFNYLKQRCPAEPHRLLTVLSYIEKNWITSATRPPSTWSTYRRVIRTNNDAEGWHHALNRRAHSNSLNMYRLFTLLFEESSQLPIRVCLIAQNKLRRHQSRQTQEKQNKLEALWEQYTFPARMITTLDFLNQCATLIDISED